MEAETGGWKNGLTIPIELGSTHGAVKYIGMRVDQPILFCVVTWMEYYDGTPGDKASGGGSFIDRHGYGYEVFNFRPFNHWYYGFVQLAGRIALERLGVERDAESVANVTVVFVAPREGRTPYVICGWYQDATVYRSYQLPPIRSKRVYRGKKIEYNLKAAKCVRIDVDDRVLQVPRGRDGIGQSRIWYADKPEHREFLKSVRRYIQTRELPKSPTRKSQTNSGGWQRDVERRQLIEKMAVRAVSKHFEALGYQIESVESLNCGWDLEATNFTSTLCLEVKGTSSSEASCEVTPNEYGPIRRQQPDYRLCVVTNALTSHRVLNVFRWSHERRAWCSGDEKLIIKELTGARLSL